MEEIMTVFQSPVMKRRKKKKSAPAENYHEKA